MYGIHWSNSLSTVCRFFICPMLCICIGQNIKSRKRPSVRPATVDKNVTLFVDQSSRSLEHSFPISYRSKAFCAVRSEVVNANAPPLIDRRLQLSSVCTNDSRSFREIMLLLCGLFQQNKC